MAIATATLRGLYEQMLLIREFETEAERQYKAARIGGYCHLSSGQEAATVGATHALDADDLLVTGYRCHGFALARGVSPEAVMAELFGRVDGCAHGRGGSMHLLDVERRLLRRLGHRRRPAADRDRARARAGPPGAPAGRALRARRRRDQHGRLARVAEPRRRLAAAGRLPRDEQRVRHGHERRARLGGAPSSTAAPPPTTCRPSASTATTCSRSRRRPRRCSTAAREERQAGVLELVTYRYRGHSVADAGLAYRTRGEIDEHLRHDPIFRVRELLAGEGVADGELDEMLETVARSASRRRSRRRSRARRRAVVDARHAACTRPAARRSSRGCCPARRSASASSSSPEGSGE